MSNLIERIKNCEGCRSRKRFLKEMLAGIGLAFLLPMKSAKATDCDCIFCPGGVSYCLCCDPSCSYCWFIDHPSDIIMCEVCNGSERCTGIGCGNGCDPGRTCTSTGQKGGMTDKDGKRFEWYWEITLTDDKETKLFIGSHDSEFDVMTWFNRHKVTDKNTDKRVWAKACHRLPLPTRA